MQGTALILVALAVVPLAAAAEPDAPKLSFSVPAQLHGSLSADQVAWALFVLGERDSLAGNLSAASALYEEVEERAVSVYDPQHHSNSTWGERLPSASRPVADLVAQLSAAGIGSVYVEAESIVVHADGSANLGLWRTGAPVQAVVGQEAVTARSVRYDVHRPPGDVLLEATTFPTPFALQASGIRVVETHGVRFTCADDFDCPDGADRESQSPVTPLLTVTAHHLSFHRFTGGDILRLEGIATQVLLGGSGFGAAADGSARFPLAQMDCDACAGPEQQTLAVTGHVRLDGVAPAPGGQLSGFVSGDLATARIDERLVDPMALLGGSLVVAGLGGVGAFLVLKVLLAPFFTRLSKEEALEHPRRKQIFDYIQEHPGANFREVARNTGIAAGTVRHHLNVLGRAGQIVEHAHGSTVRLFENHGRFDHNWSDLVLLREPALARLHAWLKENPGAPQKAVLEAMEPEGWSRSTTQHRLARLVDGGLATIRLQGRLKLYSAAERPSPKAAGLPGRGLGAPA